MKIILINIGILIFLLIGIFADKKYDGNLQNFINNTPLHKVLLTQRGYIQFLRWQLPVPDINEFTFCVWVKSSNLTFAHSIFSYSKNDTQRIVRAWISPFGRSINLEINNTILFNEPISILENQWYHICQSWDNSNGRYGLWIDGQNKLDAYSSKMAGFVIPKNGDIVLGQEYTDFDKGLEDGIEGAVLGFNLLLKSSFKKLNTLNNNNYLNNDRKKPFDYSEFERFNIDKQENLYLSSLNSRLQEEYKTGSIFPDMQFGSVIGARKTTQLSKKPSITLDKLLDDMPMGLKLIKISYNDCNCGRASPFFDAKYLLISWSRTPVRIFGGAIIKNVNNQCGVFDALL